MSSVNRSRVFAELVTVEAWHNEFGREPKVDLHASVTFKEARVGGEEESKIRFRLAVNRAELIVIVPENEPVSVDPRSVARIISEQPIVERTQIIHKKLGTNVESSLKTGLSIEAPSIISVGLSADAKAGIDNQEKITLSEKINMMIVTHSKDEYQNHRWTVEHHSKKGKLIGSPWDSEKEPRLKLRDLRGNISTGIPPAVRVELRCMREDLIISDITFKDDNFFENAKKRFGFANRMIAVEGYIRDRLLATGLEVKNIHDPFGMLTLASVTPEAS